MADETFDGEQITPDMLPAIDMALMVASGRCRMARLDNIADIVQLVRADLGRLVDAATDEGTSSR